jgi:multidrug resistance efflux pump
MSLKNDYQEKYHGKIEAQLNQWDAEINLLKAKTQNATADAKINYQKELEELESKKIVVMKKVEELKTSGAEAYEELKNSVDKACTELKHGFDSALARLK